MRAAGGGASITARSPSALSASPLAVLWRRDLRDSDRHRLSPPGQIPAKDTSEESSVGSRVTDGEHRHHPGNRPRRNRPDHHSQVLHFSRLRPMRNVRPDPAPKRGQTRLSPIGFHECRHTFRSDRKDAEGDHGTHELDVQLGGGKPAETPPKPATKSVRKQTSRRTPRTKAPTA